MKNIKENTDEKSSQDYKETDPIKTIYGKNPTASETKNARSQLSEMVAGLPWEQVSSPIKQAIRDDIAKQPAGDGIFKLGYSASVVNCALRDLGSR